MADYASLTLMDYLQSVYVPDRKIGRATRCEYRRAIRLVYKHTGRELTIGELTLDIIQGCQEWLEQNGYVLTTRKTRMCAIRTMLRHFNAAAIPEKESIYFRHADDNGTLDWLFVHHYLIAKPKLSKSTRSHYGDIIARLGRFLGEPATIEDLTHDTIAGFQAWMGQTDVCERTVLQRMSYVCSLWNWAARRRLVEEFPPPIRYVEPSGTWQNRKRPGRRPKTKVVHCSTPFLDGYEAEQQRSITNPYEKDKDRLAWLTGWLDAFQRFDATRLEFTSKSAAKPKARPVEDRARGWVYV